MTGEAGTLTALAGRNAKFDGAEIVNTGSGPVLLAAVGNLSLGTITESNRQDIVWNKRNYVRESQTGEIGSRIEANGDVTLLAGENLAARALTLEAQGDASLVAGQNLTIEAGRDTLTRDGAAYQKSKNKLTGKSKSQKQTWREAETTIQASTLSADNLTLQAGGDMTLEAVQASAREKLSLDAGGDVYILAAEATLETSQRQTNKARGVGGMGRTSLKQEVTSLDVEQIGSSLTGSEVDIHAGNNLVVQASSIKSEGRLNLQAENQIQVLAATNVSERNEKTEYKNNTLGTETFTDAQTGKNGLRNLSGMGTRNTLVSPGRIVRNLKTNEDEAGRTAARSELTGTDIALRSGSDTTLQAPVIRGETLSVRAGVDQNGNVVDEYARINLLGVKESSLDQQGHDRHSFFWDNIADRGSYNETLVLPEIHLAGTNENGSPAKADMAAPGGYTVGAMALAPTQYELAKAKAEAEARARAEAEAAEQQAEVARIKLTPRIGKDRSDTDKEQASADKATNEETTTPAREKASTAPLPQPVWQCKNAGRTPTCGWVTPPDLTLRTQATELAKTPGLEWLGDLAKRDDVDWQQVELAAKNWNYHHAGLTKEGAAVVVIVVVILTWGAASSAGAGVAQGAGMTTGTVGASGTATLTATGVAVSGAVAAGITTLASQAAVSLINNHGDIGQTLNDLGSSESVKQVVAAMLSAGLAQGATTAFNLQSPIASTAFVDRFTTYATQAAVKSGVHSAIYGEPLSETMKAALVSSLAQSLTAEVGDLGDQYGMEPGSIAKMFAHAVVQCAAASALSQDCGSAALGGAIAEALSPLGTKLDQSGYAKDNKLGGQLGNAIASMGAILVADLSGKDAMTASAAASMVDSYNRQLHPKEIGFLADKDRIKRYQEFMKDRGVALTEDQAAKALDQYGAAMADEKWATLNGRDTATEGFIVSEAAKSKDFYLDSSGKPHQLFAVSAQEYKNELINLKPLFSAYESSPAVRKYLEDNFDQDRLANWAADYKAGQQAGYDYAGKATLLDDAKTIVGALAQAPAYIKNAILSDEVGPIDDAQMKAYYETLLKLQGRGAEAGFVAEYEWTTTQRLALLGIPAAEVGGLAISTLTRLPGNLAKASMVRELRAQGVRLSEEDILAMARLPDGRIVFLERGQVDVPGIKDAGMAHIVREHGEQFAAAGISFEQLPKVLMEALKSGELVGYQGKGTGRAVYVTTVNGQQIKVAMTVGSNGYIVGANYLGRVDK